MKCFIALVLFTGFSFAASVDEMIAAKNHALNHLNQFEPGTVISNFTPTPLESALKPNDTGNTQVLQQESAHRLTQDESAGFIMREAHQRAKILPNDKSSELLDAARLIEQAEEAIQPGCHKEPVPCEEKITQQVCEEKRVIEPVVCSRTLKVRTHAIHHAEASRVFIRKLSTIDLTQCLKQDVYCTNKQVFQLHAGCEYLKINILLGNQTLQIVKQPTCQDPTVTIDGDNLPPLFRATIHVTEYRTEDIWEGERCEAALNRACSLYASTACMEANQTKLIDGVPIIRRCWGEESHYHCVGDVASNCDALLEAGCSHSKAECLLSFGEYCVVARNTFQCTERTCFPDKEVCPPEVIACADGACDQSLADESNDVNEGISRLGTLSGTASEVANNQIQSHQPSIFKGEVQECEKYILNLRDCCTDAGFLDGLIHCPADMQVLQHAKVENRAVYLGHYKHHLLGTKRYVYCVFPTKLSGIVQIQGRYNQLHIPFGEAERPDCRGITPEELERINFQALDIHDLVDELTSKKKLPDTTELSNANEAHVRALEDKGVPHD